MHSRTSSRLEIGSGDSCALEHLLEIPRVFDRAYMEQYILDLEFQGCGQEADKIIISHFTNILERLHPDKE